jgi:hypothetical protein
LSAGKIRPLDVAAVSLWVRVALSASTDLARSVDAVGGGFAIFF